MYKSSSLVTAGDEVTLARGTMALAQADGENAKVRLTREGDIEAKVNNSNIIFMVLAVEPLLMMVCFPDLILGQVFQLLAPR